MMRLVSVHQIVIHLMPKRPWFFLCGYKTAAGRPLISWQLPYIICKAEIIHHCHKYSEQTIVPWATAFHCTLFSFQLINKKCILGGVEYTGNNDAFQLISANKCPQQMASIYFTFQSSRFTSFSGSTTNRMLSVAAVLAISHKDTCATHKKKLIVRKTSLEA